MMNEIHTPSDSNKSDGITAENTSKPRFTPVMRSFHDLAEHVLGKKEDHISQKHKSVHENVADPVGWCTQSGIEFKLDGEGRFHFPISNIEGIPILPMGYGFKGGAARYLLRNQLRLSNRHQPRDFDVIRLSPQEPYVGADNDLARKYMYDDFEHDHGVEFITSLDDYFTTRDLTINEVILTNNEVIATEQAVLDTLQGRLRVTDYEYEQYQTADAKMRAKMLRMLAASFDHCLDQDDWSEWIEIPSFWLALNLDRAMQQGRGVALDYVELLQGEGLLPDELQTPEEAATYLSNHIENFDFRNVKVIDFLREREFEKLDEIQEQMSIGVKKRAA